MELISTIGGYITELERRRGNRGEERATAIERAWVESEQNKKVRHQDAAFVAASQFLNHSISVYSCHFHAIESYGEVHRVLTVAQPKPGRQRSKLDQSRKVTSGSGHET